MKKIINRILILLILIVILSEFTLPQFSTVQATQPKTVEGIDSNVINLISNLIGGIVSLIIWIPKLTATATLWVFNSLCTENLAGSEGSSGSSNSTITPLDIFFNHYNILDVNFFKQTDSAENSNGISKVILGIGNAVAKWFYIVRTISLIVLLLVLIYIGIRMALSTLATDKVLYKKMLVDWVVSVILIFVLQYIAIFIIYANEAVVKFLESLITENNFEDAIDSILLESLLGIGINGIMAFLVYTMISIQTLFFFIAYLNRMLKVAFLIIISPLISVTYSIDKIGDGKAQALIGWLKEFVYTIIIQPFDCIMYLAFVTAAMELLIPNDFLSFLGLNPQVNLLANGVLAVLCLKFINDGEKIIRKIFNFQDDNSTTSMAAGTALTLMAINKAKQGASKVNKFAGKGKELGKAIASDKIKFNDSKLMQGYQKLADKVTNSEFAQKVKEKVDTAKELKEKLDNTKLGQAVKQVGNRINSAKRKINGFKNSTAGKRFIRNYKKGTALMAGALGAAAMYATGTSGALESFAAGKRIKGTAQKALGGYGDPNNAAANASLDLEKDAQEEYQEATENLEALGLSEEEMDDTEALNQEADEADSEYEETRNDVAEEIRENKIADIDRQIEELKNNGGSEDQIKALEDEKTRLKEANVEEFFDEADKDDRVKAAEDKAVRARAISRYANKRKNIFGPNAVHKKGRKVDQSELTAQANSIMQLILAIQAQRKMGGEDEAGIDALNNITVGEYDSAERTTEKITAAISKDIKSGSDCDVRDLLRKYMGVRSFDDSNTMGYWLAREVDQYKKLIEQDELASRYESDEQDVRRQRMYSKEELSLDPDRFTREKLELEIPQERAKKEKKSRTSNEANS